jgi:hypothetical protein
MGVRQKSCAISRQADRRLNLSAPPSVVMALRPLAGESHSCRGLRYPRSPADCCQRRDASAPTAASALACAPGLGAVSGDAQLLLGRLGRCQEHELRAPTAACAIGLGFVPHQPRELQVIQPALHALAVRAYERAPLDLFGRNGAPAHHRRQPHDELLDRGRVAR